MPTDIGYRSRGIAIRELFCVNAFGWSAREVVSQMRLHRHEDNYTCVYPLRIKKQ